MSYALADLYPVGTVVRSTNDYSRRQYTVLGHNLSPQEELLVAVRGYSAGLVYLLAVTDARYLSCPPDGECSGLCRRWQTSECEARHARPRQHWMIHPT